MKKAFAMPKIVVEQFVPNEYVAACGDSGVIYKFKCDAGDNGKKYAVKDANGRVATISGMYMDGFLNYYHPCDETHEAPSDSGFLFGYHLDDPRTYGDENIQVVIWTEYDTDVHCTEDLIQSNWETAKS